MQTSDTIDLVSDALSKAQGEISPALKDKDNPAFKGTKYADLASIWDACRMPLSKNGLAVVQDVTMTDAGIAVLTRVAHKSGQWIECGPIVVPLAKRDAHGVGSATTYGKRYGLSAAIGVVAELDDDGNAATGTRQPDNQDKPQAPPASGIMQARQWISAQIHDLNGMTDASELMGFMNDNRAKWIRLREGYPKLWTAPEESGPSQVAMKVAMRLECGDEMARFLNEVEGEADQRAFKVAAE